MSIITTKNKRITIILTSEMELLLNEMKKEKFYNSSQSEMLRTLIEVGCNVTKNKKQSDLS